jgi:hypothetical protein
MEAFIRSARSSKHEPVDAVNAFKGVDEGRKHEEWNMIPFLGFCRLMTNEGGD